jgi:hypothetical protein
MIRILITLIFALSINLLSSAQTKDSIDKVLTIEPILFLDEVRISSEDMQKINPNDLAAIEVLKDSSAIKRLGDEGKNGVIYITTLTHAREKYIAYLRSKSKEYANVVQSIDDEINVVYILNNKILKKENAGDIYLINDENYIDLKIISDTELQQEYSIPDKKIEIILTTKQVSKE